MEGSFYTIGILENILDEQKQADLNLGLIQQFLNLMIPKDTHPISIKI